MSRVSIVTFITFTLLVSTIISQSEAGVWILDGQDQTFNYEYKGDTEIREEYSAFPIDFSVKDTRSRYVFTSTESPTKKYCPSGYEYVAGECRIVSGKYPSSPSYGIAPAILCPGEKVFVDGACRFVIEVPKEDFKSKGRTGK